MSVNEQLPDTSAPAPSGSDAPKDGGRLWRSLWRTHFYAGIFSMPVLIMLAASMFLRSLSAVFQSFFSRGSSKMIIFFAIQVYLVYLVKCKH
jgi:hypothetical protein